jgi:hypothetical protein
MSDAEQSPDATRQQATDESARADSSVAADADQQELDWDAATAGFAKQRDQRKTVGVEIPGAGVATFTLRGLRRDERDEVEKQAASVSQGRGGEVEIDTGAMRRTMLQYGIVSGPDGFNPDREDHLDQLPPGVQDELVEIVEEMSTLTVAERDGFQTVG